MGCDVMVKVSVSILSSNDKRKAISLLNKTNADYLHVDVMDGKFVEEKSLDFSKMKDLLKNSNLPLDVHLMVANPNKLIEGYALLKTEFITIHYELDKDVNVYLDKIKSYGIKCGISIKPNTKVEAIYHLLDKIDLVLIMSVEPGYGGQEFIESTLSKIETLKEEIVSRKLNVLIEVDGGIDNETAKLCILKGVDILVSGSYITSSNNYQEKINELKNN
jgi:ribulose-phosphate 3-epimerase